MDPFAGFTQGGRLDGSANTGPDMGEPEEETSNLGTAGQLLALAGNSAAFGMAPKLAYMAGRLGGKEKAEEWEQGTKKYLDKGREENPVAGVIAEIAGGLVVPIPGVGFAKGGATLAARLGGGAITQGLVKGGLHGAVGGAMQGAGRAYGEGGTEGLVEGGKAALEGGIEGGVLGGIMGGAMGGIGGKIAESADSLRAATTGAGADSARKAARWSLSRRPGKAWEHVTSEQGPLAHAEQLFTEDGKRVLGGLGQTSKTVFQRASEVAEDAGQKLEATIAKASKEPVTKVKNSQLTDIVTDLHDQLMTNAAPAEYREAAEKFFDWSANTLKRNQYTLSELHQMSRNISNVLGGPQHSLAPTDNLINSLKKQFAHDLRELVVRQAQKIPDSTLAKEIAHWSGNFNAAATARDMAATSVPRWDLVKTSILGKGLMHQASTAALTATGINPVLARHFSSIVSEPGVLPNSALWLNRLASGRTQVDLPTGVKENVIKAMMRGAYNKGGKHSIQSRMNTGSIPASIVGATRNKDYSD
jgi:hypothetical protein